LDRLSGHVFQQGIAQGTARQGAPPQRVPARNLRELIIQPITLQEYCVSPRQSCSGPPACNHNPALGTGAVHQAVVRRLLRVGRVESQQPEPPDQLARSAIDEKADFVKRLIPVGPLTRSGILARLGAVGILIRPWGAEISIRPGPVCRTAHCTSSALTLWNSNLN
jgi:hypothetical protein